MSFGQRRFDRLVLVSGEPCARFLPLDLGRVAELLNEAQLRAEIETNGHSLAPLAYPEEQIALNAFVAFAKNPKGSPLRTAIAQAARTARQQEPTLVIVDPLSPKERATVERWRKLLTLLAVRPRTVDAHIDNTKELISSRHDERDLERAVLAIFDTHLPKGS